MILVKILLGLIALCVVVIVHELGHFFAARLFGVKVEAFSIGWGKVLFAWKKKGTEYRISLLPLGGYCKLKGEAEFKKAIESKAEAILPEPESFFAAAPLKRIAIQAAGPLFNLLFSIAVFSIVWGFGYSVRTLGNRIVLASEYPLSATPQASYPADAAGLKTGDRIIAIDGKPTNTYLDIQEIISSRPNTRLAIQVSRGTDILELRATAELDRTSGAGKIGVYAWTEPIVTTLAKSSAGEIAGLLPGDRILSVNGKKVEHSIDILSALKAKPERIRIGFSRAQTERFADCVLSYTDTGESNLGISFPTIEYRTPRMDPFSASVKGFSETMKMIAVSFKSLGLLFKGLKITSAVSGPIRIGFMVSEATEAGLSEGLGNGISVLLNFLSLISVALFVMNCLPIPILDGGQILISLIEFFRRKALRPKVMYYYTIVGNFMILAILSVAILSDVMFFSNRP